MIDNSRSLYCSSCIPVHFNENLLSRYSNASDKDGKMSTRVMQDAFRGRNPGSMIQ